MSDEPKWLLTEVLIECHTALVKAHGGAGTAVRDLNALESACARAKQLYHYDPTASLARLAARYAVGISKNHPFVDGNKRVTLLAMGIFLDINGITFTASNAVAAAAILMLADGKISEDEFAQFISDHTDPRAG